jgi:hypothetical protein
MHRRFHILIFSSVGDTDVSVFVFSLLPARENVGHAIKVPRKAATPNGKMGKW